MQPFDPVPTLLTLIQAGQYLPAQGFLDAYLGQEADSDNPGSNASTQALIESLQSDPRFQPQADWFETEEAREALAHNAVASLGALGVDPLAVMARLLTSEPVR